MRAHPQWLSLMFIAHLPSGYIMSVSILKRIRHVSAPASTTLLSGMVGAIAPDFDLFYFYLVDHRQTLHHKYFTHWPLFWLALSAACALWLRLSSRPIAAHLGLVFCLGGVLHLLLDSVVGEVQWLAPFSDRFYSLFHVRAVFKPWWLNFALHWSFALEIAICLWALWLYRQRRRDGIAGGAQA